MTPTSGPEVHAELPGRFARLGEVLDLDHAADADVDLVEVLDGGHDGPETTAAAGGAGTTGSGWGARFGARLGRRVVRRGLLRRAVWPRGASMPTPVPGVTGLVRGGSVVVPVSSWTGAGAGGGVGAGGVAAGTGAGGRTATGAEAWRRPARPSFRPRRAWARPWPAWGAATGAGLATTGPGPPARGRSLGHDRGLRRVALGHVVDLDGARGDDHRGGHAGRGLGGQGAHAGRDGSAGRGAAGGGAPGGQARAAGGGRARGHRAGGGAAAEAQVGDAELLEEDQRADGKHGGQRLGGGLQLAAEGAAALTVLEVAARRGGGAA